MLALPSHSILLRTIPHRWLLLTTSLLLVGSLFPLFLTPILPSTDLGAHVGLAAQIPRLLMGNPVTSRHFELLPMLGPHSLPYAILATGNVAFGAFGAAKLLVGLSLVLLPLGTMRLLVAIGRSPWMGLWAFATAWDFNMSIGFVAFHLGTGLGLFFVASAYETASQPRPSPKSWAATVGWGTLLALTHAQSVGTASLMLLALAATEWGHWARLRRLAGAAMLPAALLLPWLVNIFATAEPIENLEGPLLDFSTLGLRAKQLFLSTHDLATPIASRNIEGLTFLVLALLPLLFGLAGHQDRRVLTRGLALYVSAWMLYLLMPETMFWPRPHVLLNQRHGTLILLAGLSLVDLGGSGPSNLPRRSWMLLPGLAAALAMFGVVSAQHRSFARHAVPVFSLIDAIEDDSRVNWVLWQTSTSETVRKTLPMTQGYVVAERGGYVPHLFTGRGLPVDYIEKEHLPHMPWGLPNAFHPITHARGYDYVVVQGEKPWTPPSVKQSSKQKKRTAHENSGSEQDGVKSAEASVPEAPSRRDRLASTRTLSVEFETRAGLWNLYHVSESPRHRQ